MKEKRYKCFVCGQKYLQSSVKPVIFYDDMVSKKWETVTHIYYGDEKIPLCNEHFRMYMLFFLTKNKYKINIDGEHINE